MTATLLAPRAAADLVDELLLYARLQLVKASRPRGTHDRQALFGRVVPDFAADLAAYFEGLADRLSRRVHKALPDDWLNGAVEWDVEERELNAVIGRWYETLGQEAYASVSAELAADVRWDLNNRGVKQVLDRVGQQVKDINEVSRTYLQTKVEQAVDHGYSVEQLIRGEPADGWGGIRQLVDSWASTPEGGTQSRAYTIALTETGNAMNLASVNAYRDSGLVEQVEVLDGDGCEACAEINGQIWTLDEAEANPLEHPNCTRSFSPVVLR